ncbi:hypothetical protein LWI28_026458 [Acer negundo]|uniref:Uncharacterized protein n=1 Tax=Acer negundo TaxID=4023 RepID=A0AAD5P0E2_ACENE|nr:hypothetical protein LWI28_026458 [Acer negundo]
MSDGSDSKEAFDYSFSSGSGSEEAFSLVFKSKKRKKHPISNTEGGSLRLRQSGHHSKFKSGFTNTAGSPLSISEEGESKEEEGGGVEEVSIAMGVTLTIPEGFGCVTNSTATEETLIRLRCEYGIPKETTKLVTPFQTAPSLTKSTPPNPPGSSRSKKKRGRGNGPAPSGFPNCISLIPALLNPAFWNFRVGWGAVKPSCNYLSSVSSGVQIESSSCYAPNPPTAHSLLSGMAAKAVRILHSSRQTHKQVPVTPPTQPAVVQQQDKNLEEVVARFMKVCLIDSMQAESSMPWDVMVLKGASLIAVVQPFLFSFLLAFPTVMYPAVILPVAPLVSLSPSSVSPTANVGISLRSSRLTHNPPLTPAKSRTSLPAKLSTPPMARSSLSEMVARASRVRSIPGQIQR